MKSIDNLIAKATGTPATSTTGTVSVNPAVADRATALEKLIKFVRLTDELLEVINAPTADRADMLGLLESLQRLYVRVPTDVAAATYTDEKFEQHINSLLDIYRLESIYVGINTQLEPMRSTSYPEEVADVLVHWLTGVEDMEEFLQLEIAETLKKQKSHRQEEGVRADQIVVPVQGESDVEDKAEEPVPESPAADIEQELGVERPEEGAKGAQTRRVRINSTLQTV